MGDGIELRWRAGTTWFKGAAQGERISMFLLHKELWNYEFTLKEHLAI